MTYATKRLLKETEARRTARIKAGVFSEPDEGWSEELMDYLHELETAYLVSVNDIERKKRHQKMLDKWPVIGLTE